MTEEHRLTRPSETDEIEFSFWRRNLVVCLFGSFTTVLAMTILLPFLPVYVEHLGVSDHGEVLWWSGAAYGATFLSAALVAPLWGRLGDLYGRKLMLVRASLGMAVAMSLIGLAQDVWQLTALRLLAGVLGGYASGSVILVAAQTPRAHMSRALGLLSMGVMTGTLGGPLIGGILPTFIGIRWTFFAAGGVIFIAFLATAFLVREDARFRAAKAMGQKRPGLWSSVSTKTPVLAMLGSAFLVMFATMSVEPVLTVYVGMLDPSASVERTTFLSGLIFSGTALGSILSAYWAGRLADRIGPWRVVTGSLALIALLVSPQAFVTSPWQLLALRFLMGLGAGGLMACITSVIRQNVPEGGVGVVLGASTSVQYIGQVAGPLAGGMIGASLGLRAVFLVTAALMALGALGNGLISRRQRLFKESP